MTRAAAALAIVAISIGVWAHWPTRQPPPDTKADRVLVEKSRRRLTLLRDGHPISTYRIALGSQPIGTKHREGDGRTPEGTYVIDSRNDATTFHRALHISYPDAADRLAARRAHVDPGGAILIHGLRNDLRWVGRAHRLVDWTSGCIAVTNAEIDEIWRLVPTGTVVDIRP